MKRVTKSVTVLARSISRRGDGCQAAPASLVRRNGAAARVISELEELVQGVVALLLLVLSLLAVAKSSSSLFEDVG